MERRLFVEIKVCRQESIVVIVALNEPDFSGRGGT